MIKSKSYKTEMMQNNSPELSCLYFHKITITNDRTIENTPKLFCLIRVPFFLVLLGAVYGFAQTHFDVFPDSVFLDPHLLGGSLLPCWPVWPCMAIYGQIIAILWQYMAMYCNIITMYIHIIGHMWAYTAMLQPHDS